jgi:hypothetical protein
MQHYHFDRVSRHKVKVVVAGAQIGAGMANKEILYDWSCT